MIKKISKTEGEWKNILTPEQFQVMRKKGTEAPFSCAWKKLEDGTYHCAACDLTLFKSQTKYESGTGWPSFFGPVAPDHIEYREDTSHGMNRIEVLCARCDSHLGHVFPENKTPTGKRYCINSVVLKFKPDKS